jgi:uracil-DNA glycosylase
MSSKLLVSFVTAASFVWSGCTHVGQVNVGSNNTDIRNPAATNDRRGSPAEYDAGAPKDSEWADIFAETPDYRSYGKAVYQAAAKKAGISDDGQEKFRWKVGPMWYRGRLTPNSVKVFVIGQEGAQDENVSNRTFTGSTGTKMQNFINYLGIDRSYLFMNTFIYTITGQYGEQPKPGDSAQVIKEKQVRSQALRWIAQSPDSVVVQHRQRMFDYMLSQNKNTVRLIIGVGAAGKDTLASWIKSHGGKCTSQQLGSSFCDASVIAPGARAIGVMHPGAASAANGGSGAASQLQVQFGERADLVSSWIKADPNWLKPDGAAPSLTNFRFQDAPIPHRDFAFNTMWRMGKEGTSTNRRGADGIQIFSDAGCYNNIMRLENGKCDRDNPSTGYKARALNVIYEDQPDLTGAPRMAPEDFPYESPKSAEGRRQYDQGPGAEFAPLMTNWPDFAALGITSHKSLGFNGTFRGNPENAKVVILADQESNDDMFSTRALTGTGGQKLQTLLNNMGLKNDYVIVRTLPVDSIDLSVSKVKEIASNSEVVRSRNAILERILQKGKTKLFITVGPVAASLVPATYNPAGVPLVSLDAPEQNSHVAQWQSAISKLSVPGISLQKAYDGSLSVIPRTDLPIHTRWWMGSSGTRSARAKVNGVYNGDYYQFNAPNWVSTKNYPANPQSLANRQNDPYKAAYATSLQSFGGSFKIESNQDAALNEVGN